MSTAPDHMSTHESESDGRNQSLKVYLNGTIVPREQAFVSVYDAGFMLGMAFGRASVSTMGSGPSSRITWTACMSLLV